MMQRMYIGPAIPGVVKNSVIFIGDLPEQLTEIAKEIPSIKNLVIPIDRITEAKQALSEQGSVEEVSYWRIVDYLKGER